jgi:hypothetical protein
MGLFKNEAAAQAKLDELNTNIVQLTERIGELRAEKKELVKLSVLQSERDDLREEINNLKIDKSKIEEKHARELREVEHKIGLQRIQAEHEADNQKKQARLEVREANLEHEKAQFDTNMKFQKEEFDRQAKYLQGLMESVLARLPNVNVNHEITETREIEAPKAATRRGRSTS